MTDLDELQDRYAQFVAEREWERFHTPKNLAEAISIEANELLELFLWHDNYDPHAIRDDRELMADIEEELADVVIYCLGLATRLEINLLDAVETKLEANETRFDMETSEEIAVELDTWKRDR